MKFRRCDLGEHLKNECEYRNVKCDYCKNDVASALIKVRINKLRNGEPQAILSVRIEIKFK